MLAPRPTPKLEDYLSSAVRGCLYKITFKRGKLTNSQNFVIDINREIQESEQGKTYKYLGIEEGEGYNINKRKKD